MRRFHSKSNDLSLSPKFSLKQNEKKKQKQTLLQSYINHILILTKALSVQKKAGFLFLSKIFA